MSIAQVTHDRADAGIRQDEWEEFCATKGLTQSTPAGDTWYDAGQQIQVVRQGRRHVSFRTYRAGQQVPEVARLALACWARFGGRLTASPQITSIISQEVQAATASTPVGIRQLIAVRSKGELVRHLIDMRISCLDASDLADLDEGDQHAVDLGNHACGGRALGGPHHDLWTIAVTGGWWLLLPAPGDQSCQAVACDGTYAPRPRSADPVPAEASPQEPF